jgi:hypothetical protein
MESARCKFGAARRITVARCLADSSENVRVLRNVRLRSPLPRPKQNQLNPNLTSHGAFERHQLGTAPQSNAATPPSRRQARNAVCLRGSGAGVCGRSLRASIVASTAAVAMPNADSPTRRRVPTVEEVPCPEGMRSRCRREERSTAGAAFKRVKSLRGLASAWCTLLSPHRVLAVSPMNCTVDCKQDDGRTETEIG